MGKGDVLVRGLCCKGDKGEVNVGCLNLENKEQNESVHIEFKKIESVDKLVNSLRELKIEMQRNL